MSIFDDEAFLIHVDPRGRPRSPAPASRPAARRGGARRASSAKNQVRAAAGHKEAVYKIVSKLTDPSGVRRAVRYVTRNGELKMIDERGAAQLGKDGLEDVIDVWEATYSDRKNARLALHEIVSAPPETDREAFKRAALDFASRTFGQDYHYGVAFHFDEDHPHAHIIRTRREGGPALNPRKADLDRYREAWAAAAQEQGIELTATPRASRGATRKGERRAVLAIMEREGVAKVQVSAAQAALAEVAGVRNEDAAAASRHSKAATEHHRQQFDGLARSLATLVRERPDDQDLAQLAKMVRKQAVGLRHQGTRHETMVAIARREGWSPETKDGVAKLLTTYEAEKAREREAYVVAPNRIEAALSTARDRIEGMSGKAAEVVVRGIDDALDAER